MNPKHPKIYTTTFDVHLPATKDQPGRFLETIEVEVFRSFGEEVLTPESSEKVERIKARHLGLMTGADIKAMRERLKLSQKKLTALLQCGEKTLSHWENGHGHPTGLSNTILRLLDEGFIAPASLEAVQGPRRPLASERYLQTRKVDAIHYDFSRSRIRQIPPEAWDESILSTAANP
jgi:DNA-binding transcriptional regulator YiaG